MWYDAESIEEIEREQLEEYFPSASRKPGLPLPPPSVFQSPEKNNSEQVPPAAPFSPPARSIIMAEAPHEDGVFAMDDISSAKLPSNNSTIVPASPVPLSETAASATTRLKTSVPLTWEFHDSYQAKLRSHPRYDEIMKDRVAISELLASHTCWEVIPDSGKIVIIDTGITVKSAFAAMMENEIRCAPLWDHNKKEFVGLMTLSDFINILRHTHVRKDFPQDTILKELENKRITDCKELSASKPYVKLIVMHPEDHLFDAAKMLVHYKIHRMPITDSHDRSIIHILTHAKILQYLLTLMQDPLPMVFSCKLDELRVGTYEHIKFVNKGTHLIKIFDIMTETGYSAIPIVDENDALVDIYSKGDAPSLAFHRTYSQLDRPVEDVIAESRGSKKIINTCSLSDTLGDIIGKLIRMKTHRLFCVDEKQRILGIVSLIDILRFLLVDNSKAKVEVTSAPPANINLDP